MRRKLTAAAMVLTIGCSSKNEDSGGECADTMSVSGELRMGEATLPIDETAGLVFGTVHKMDVDLYEAGCISDITLEIKQQGVGCRLAVEFVRDSVSNL